MAKASNKVSTFFSFAFVLSLILIISISESRAIFGGRGEKVSCESVIGVESGDTCFEIAKSQNLSTPAFETINPNLNCTALFVGQWICISGSQP